MEEENPPIRVHRQMQNTSCQSMIIIDLMTGKLDILAQNDFEKAFTLK